MSGQDKAKVVRCTRSFVIGYLELLWLGRPASAGHGNNQCETWLN